MRRSYYSGDPASVSPAPRAARSARGTRSVRELRLRCTSPLLSWFDQTRLFPLAQPTNLGVWRRGTTRRTQRTSNRGGAEHAATWQSKKGTKRARQYEHIKDSIVERGGVGGRGRGDRGADGEQGARAERRGEGVLEASREDISSGRRGGIRSHRKSPRGRTRDQLYEEAKAAQHPRPLDDDEGRAPARARRPSLTEVSPRARERVRDSR